MSIIRAGEHIKIVRDTNDQGVPVGISGRVMSTSSTLAIYIQPDHHTFLNPRTGQTTKLGKVIKASALDVEVLH